MGYWSQPSQALLHELFDYDPKTGVLIWRPRTGKWSLRWNALHAGNVAGAVHPGGEIVIKIYNRNFLAHRIIWAMHHGTWPECVVHRNRRQGDNRIRNLRDGNRKSVGRRLGLYRTNTSGISGVSWNRCTLKWVASIRVDDVTINLGSYDHKEDAAKARRAGERRRDRHGL